MSVEHASISFAYEPGVIIEEKREAVKRDFMNQNINKMQDAIALTKPEKRYFSTLEVIAFLKDYAGMVVSRSTLFKWSMDGKIPYRKAPNGRLLFPCREVQSWIDGSGAEAQIGNSEQGDR